MFTAFASIVAALIAGIAGYATSRMNYQAQQETNATNLQSVQETNALNRELAGQANQWQSEEWLRQFNMTNEYNLPVNQIQRYKDAGLNPSLAMGGNLVDATASQGSTPSANLASMQPFHAIAPQMSSDWIQSIGSDTALKLAQADLLRAQADEVRSMLPGKLNQLSGEIEKSNKELQIMEQTVQTMEQDRYLAILRNAREDKLAENDTQRTLDNTRLTDANIDEIIHKNGLTDAQAEQARAVASLTARQLLELKKTFALRLKGFDLSNEKLLSEIGLNRQQVEYYDKVIEGLGYDNISKSFNSLLVKSLLKDDGTVYEGSKFAHRLGWLVSELTQFMRIFSPSH